MLRTLGAGQGTGTGPPVVILVPGLFLQEHVMHQGLRDAISTSLAWLGVLHPSDLS